MTKWSRSTVTLALTAVILCVQSVAFAADGALDRTFSGDGKTFTKVGTSSASGHDVAVQNDGRIVVVGYAHNHGVGTFGILRYMPHGALDRSFGGDGKVVTIIGDDASARGVLIQPDGKIVAAGYAVLGGRRRFALARYGPGGGLDPTFGGDGLVTTSFSNLPTDALDIALQSDGKLVVAGSAGRRRFAVARYRPNGLLDLSFGGGDGKVTSSFPGSCCASAQGVALQPDGKIVAGGWYASGFAIARYRPGGGLDPTFSENGKAHTPMEGLLAEGFGDLALQGDRIVVAGSATVPRRGFQFALVRYRSGGGLDRSFGGDGRVQTAFENGESAAAALAVQSDGKLIVAGRLIFTVARFALSRYHFDGSLDRSFGGDGRVLTAVGSAGADGVALQADGKIVAAGEASVNGHRGFATARYWGR